MSGTASAMMQSALLVVATAAACGHPAAKVAGDAASLPGATTLSMEEQGIAAAIDRAEDQRRATDVLATWQVSANPVLRRQAIRALARIAEPPIDAATDKALLRALGDEDLEVAGWAAYGLGWACKGKEEEHVKALAARATTLADADASVAMTRRDAIDAPATITYAIGRCGGRWPRARSRASSAAIRARLRPEAAYALGSLAGKGPLSATRPWARSSIARRRTCGPRRRGRALPDRPPRPRPGSLDARVLAAARACSRRRHPCGGMAVRAIEKAGPGAMPDLVRSRRPGGLNPAERAEAARALGRLGAPDARGPRPRSRA